MCGTLFLYQIWRKYSSFLKIEHSEIIFFEKKRKILLFVCLFTVQAFYLPLIDNILSPNECTPPISCARRKGSNRWEHRRARVFPDTSPTSDSSGRRRTTPGAEARGVLC
jgi:hypothetical protein